MTVNGSVHSRTRTPPAGTVRRSFLARQHRLRAIQAAQIEHRFTDLIRSVHRLIRHGHAALNSLAVILYRNLSGSRQSRRSAAVSAAVHQESDFAAVRAGRVTSFAVL